MLMSLGGRTLARGRTASVELYLVDRIWKRFGLTHKISTSAPLPKQCLETKEICMLPPLLNLCPLTVHYCSNCFGAVSCCRVHCGKLVKSNLCVVSLTAVGWQLRSWTYVTQSSAFLVFILLVFWLHCLLFSTYTETIHYSKAYRFLFNRAS